MNPDKLERTRSSLSYFILSVLVISVFQSSVRIESSLFEILVFPDDQRGFIRLRIRSDSHIDRNEGDQID
jgi:hypothetical protein